MGHGRDVWPPVQGPRERTCRYREGGVVGVERGNHAEERLPVRLARRREPLGTLARESEDDDTEKSNDDRAYGE